MTPEPWRAKVLNALYESPLGPVGLLWIGGSLFLALPLFLLVDLFEVFRYALISVFSLEMLWLLFGGLVLLWYGMRLLALRVWHYVTAPRRQVDA